MINFRFHVVSLIAIFLALALGVVIGAGVIDRGVVDALDNRLDSVESKSDRIQGENDALTDRNDQMDDDDRRPAAVRGERPAPRRRRRRGRGARRRRRPGLGPGRPPRSRPTPPPPARCGSRTSGRSADDDSVKALQDALGTTTKNKTTLRDGGLPAARAAPGRRPTRARARRTCSSSLQQAGFLGFDAVGDSTITDFPGRGAGIVLVVGNGGSVEPGARHRAGGEGAARGRGPAGGRQRVGRGADGPDRADAVQPIRDSDARDHGVDGRRPRPRRGPHHGRARAVRPVPAASRSWATTATGPNATPAARSRDRRGVSGRVVSGRGSRPRATRRVACSPRDRRSSSLAALARARRVPRPRPRRARDAC